MEAMSNLIERLFSPQTARLVIKEIMLMARDWGRLSQLLLLLALIVVYLYNFSVLPSLDSPMLAFFFKNTMAFINIGLAGFVLSSLGVRFLFPAISGEGRAFWILKKGPIDLKKVLWVKFLFYLAPMMILGIFLVVMTNRLLELDFFMSSVSTVTIAILTAGLTSLSLGMGVIHADFKEVDPNRAVTGFGGLLTMIYGGLAVAGVILLEAYPVYVVLRSQFMGYTLRTAHYAGIIICFALAFALAVYLIVKPLRMGMARISTLEI
jgi:ABC-2 type transport system permease protein